MTADADPPSDGLAGIRVVADDRMPPGIAALVSPGCEPAVFRVGEYEYDDDAQDGVIPPPIYGADGKIARPH